MKSEKEIQELYNLTLETEEDILRDFEEYKERFPKVSADRYRKILEERGKRWTYGAIEEYG